MSFASYLLGLYLSLAAVCIIAGIILTWANRQKQEPDAIPKEEYPRDQFPCEHYYCKQCGWTTQSVHLYKRCGFSHEPSVSLCSLCVERMNQKRTVMIPFDLFLPRI